MTGRFTNGTYVNEHCGVRHHRVTAGPQRDRYVHDLIMEARLGRKLLPDETVDHVDGNSLNLDWEKLEVVSRAENTRRMMERRKQCTQSASS
jgi:HNH endonuclease